MLQYDHLLFTFFCLSSYLEIDFPSIRTIYLTLHFFRFCMTGRRIWLHCMETFRELSKKIFLLNLTNGTTVGGFTNGLQVKHFYLIFEIIQCEFRRSSSKRIQTYFIRCHLSVYVMTHNISSHLITSHHVSLISSHFPFHF